MGTTAEKLNKLSETKALLKTRLTEKGVDVAAENNFHNLADKVGEIESGSGAQTVVGTCTLYDAFNKGQSVPIYQGFPPLDLLAIFHTSYDVEKKNAETAEYVSWAALESGDYVFYRGVKDGDSFQEKMV